MEDDLIPEDFPQIAFTIIGAIALGGTVYFLVCAVLGMAP